MNWETASKRYAPILRSEIRLRCHSRHNPNADWDDYYQTAALAAWEYCRDKTEKQIDGRVLRIVVRRALYNMSAKSHGVCLNHNTYKKWASGSGIPASLDALQELTGDGCSAVGGVMDDTVFTVAAFIATLPLDEKEALAHCVATGYRDSASLSRVMGVDRRCVRRSLTHLRKRCQQYFMSRTAA